MATKAALCSFYALNRKIAKIAIRKKWIICLPRTVSPKPKKLESHTTSHMKGLKKIFPVDIKFLDLFNFKAENRSLIIDCFFCNFKMNFAVENVYLHFRSLYLLNAKSYRADQKRF